MLKSLFDTDDKGNPIIDDESKRIFNIGDEIMCVLLKHNLTAGEGKDVIDYVSRQISRMALSAGLAKVIYSSEKGTENEL